MSEHAEDTVVAMHYRLPDLSRFTNAAEFLRRPKSGAFRWVDDLDESLTQHEQAAANALERLVIHRLKEN